MVEIRKVSIYQLKPFPDPDILKMINEATPKESLQQISESVTSYGLDTQDFPIIVDRNYYIIDGYVRYRMALEKGIPEVDVIYRGDIDLDAKQNVTEAYKIIRKSFSRRHLPIPSLVYIISRLEEKIKGKRPTPAEIKQIANIDTTDNRTIAYYQNLGYKYSWLFESGIMDKIDITKLKEIDSMCPSVLTKLKSNYEQGNMTSNEIIDSINIGRKLCYTQGMGSQNSTESLEEKMEITEEDEEPIYIDVQTPTTAEESEDIEETPAEVSAKSLEQTQTDDLDDLRDIKTDWLKSFIMLGYIDKDVAKSLEQIYGNEEIRELDGSVINAFRTFPKRLGSSNLTTLVTRKELLNEMLNNKELGLKLLRGEIPFEEYERTVRRKIETTEFLFDLFSTFRVFIDPNKQDEMVVPETFIDLLDTYMPNGYSIVEERGRKEIKLK